jgi:hypothetical protein
MSVRAVVSRSKAVSAIVAARLVEVCARSFGQTMT